MTPHADIRDLSTLADFDWDVAAGPLSLIACALLLLAFAGWWEGRDLK